VNQKAYVACNFNCRIETEERLKVTGSSWVPASSDEDLVMRSKRQNKVGLDYAKSSFYRAANAIFGKVGRLASEEVTLELITRTHQ